MATNQKNGGKSGSFSNLNAATRRALFSMGILVLLFAAFLAVPIIRLLGESFVLDTGWGMENYTAVLTGKGFAESPAADCDLYDYRLRTDILSGLRRKRSECGRFDGIVRDHHGKPADHGTAALALCYIVPYHGCFDRYHERIFY